MSKRLIIDSDNYQAAGVKTFFFPGGEPNAILTDSKQIEEADVILLYLKLRTWNSVGLAAMVINVLRGWSGKKLLFFIPYFPGARQDRRGEDSSSPIAPEVIFNTLGLIIGRDVIYTFDQHSNILKNFVDCNLMPSNLYDLIKPHVYGVDMIIAPDHGSVNRAESFRDNICQNADVIFCDKKRDFATGKLTGFEMPKLKKAGKYLIVDDIFDGGWTFNKVAEAFAADPNSENSTLQLFVSHGIFSKGFGGIHPKIQRIITTNSWTSYESGDYCFGRLEVVKLEPLLDYLI